jgi:hypothetical protein
VGDEEIRKDPEEEVMGSEPLAVDTVGTGCSLCRGSWAAGNGCRCSRAFSPTGRRVTDMSPFRTMPGGGQAGQGLGQRDS